MEKWFSDYPADMARAYLSADPAPEYAEKSTSEKSSYA